MRAFLVGSPRSGTTLLQKLIASHSGITTFPETHYFTKLHRPGILGKWWPLPRRQAARQALVTFLKNMGRSDLLPELSALDSTWTNTGYTRFFLRLLDRLADEQGYSAWLEKTPMHLHFIQTITKAAPEARFIHIVREGLYTIASVYGITNTPPYAWGGKRSLEDCVTRWKLDIALSKKWLGNANHHFVRYETLVSKPEAVMREVFAFLGLEYEAFNEETQTIAAEEIQTTDEVWKEDVFKPLNEIDREKYVNQLTSAERDYVERSIGEVNLEVFG